MPFWGTKIRLFSAYSKYSITVPCSLKKTNIMAKANTKEIPAAQREALLKTLKARFEKNMNRHKGIDWAALELKLESNTDKLWSLNEMETTGGEPDVVGYDKKTGEHIFYDCSPESPKDRRSLCYDRAAWDSRKENKPKNNAMDMAAAMGIEMLTEAEYQQLQQLGSFEDRKSVV